MGKHRQGGYVPDTLPAGLFCLLLACAGALGGCLPPVEIVTIEPDSSNVGDIVAIQGYGFGPVQGASTILFQHGDTAEVLSWNDSEIMIIVPTGTPSGNVGVTANILMGELSQFDTAYLLVEATPIQYRMLAFGDSITSGESTTNGGYTYYLENTLDAEVGSTVVINAGKVGELTSDGLARFDSALTKWNDVEFVLLMEGTNDVSDSSGAGPLESIISNLRGMIEIARDDHAMEVVLGTIPPRLNDFDDQASPTTLELVEGIRDLATEESIPLADHYQYFTDMTEWETLFFDAIHPNDQGYEALADSWMQGALEQLLP